MDVGVEAEASEARERRAGADRRGRRTPMLSRFLFRGRRAGGRRTGEREQIYVDRPGGWVAVAFASLVTLSLLDAWFTLDLLSQGATEANPVMAYALTFGDRVFLAVKTVVTVLGAGFLCLHKNWPLGRMCLGLALGGYTALLGYHLYAQTII
jgi:hypothetical protein